MDNLWHTFMTGLAQGVTGWTWWQVLLYTLGSTHVTIIAVTLFLHRAQAHRALELHAVVAHFLRLWLWLGTGMVTKEWVAIHRKHHAKCETAEDPHSPQHYGIKKVFWQGAELYRQESTNAETLARYGHGTPDDWIERHLYSRYTWQGVGLMLILNLVLFGALGLTVWAVQMLWIPISAAGIINGIGHYWGYRNYEAPDTSTNIVPWGILIGGEELHNNHHTYPTSAKFKVKPYEFDLGWVYIALLSKLGLATIKKTPPVLGLGQVRPVADAATLQALIVHRYEMMARYGRELRAMVQSEIQELKRRSLGPAKDSPYWRCLQTARRWLHRDLQNLPAAVQADLDQVQSYQPALARMVAMRDELKQMWQSTHMSQAQLVQTLRAWCERAEASGVQALQDFSLRLRSAQA